MKHLAIVCILVSLGCFVERIVAADPLPPLEGTWELTFEDNFDGSAVDGSKWKFGANGAHFNGLSSLDPSCITVSDGKLKITAKHKVTTFASDTRDYASGELSGFYKFSQQYGYFEARAKYPPVTGLWPAFWLRADRGLYGDRQRHYRSYLKFDLTGSAVGQAASAELRLHTSLVETNTNNLLLMKLADDTWSEATLTWNNRPHPDPVFIEQRWDIQGPDEQVISFDVTDWVNEQLAGDGVASFVLADTYARIRQINFHSSEAADPSLRPVLIIDGLPYPATDDAYVRWGSLADTNYGDEDSLVVREQWGNNGHTFDGGMEIDILESLGIWGRDVTQHALHWDGYAEEHQHLNLGRHYVPETEDGFHTYGVYWENGLIEMYVDGVRTAVHADPRVMSVPATMVVGLQIGGWNNNNPHPGVDGHSLEFDWVRVWSGTKAALQPNRPPLVGAGPEITLPHGTLTTPLEGRVLDESPPVVEWSRLSGPGDAVFADPSLAGTTVTFSEPGVHLLRLTANDGEFPESDEVLVIVEDTLADWMGRRGLTDADGDVDGDSVTERWEYAFATDPGDRLSVFHPLADFDGDRYRVTARRSLSAADLIWRGEATTSLENWAEVPITSVEPAFVGDSAEMLQIRLPDEAGYGVRGFLRFVIRGDQTE